MKSSRKPNQRPPRRVQREMGRKARRAFKALERGDLEAAHKLGLAMRHRVRLVRDGTVVLELGGDE